MDKPDLAGLVGTTLSRRDLLAHWKVRFRTHESVTRITLDLTEAGLATMPDLAEGPLGETVRVVPLPGAGAGQDDGADEGGDAGAGADEGGGRGAGAREHARETPAPDPGPDAAGDSDPDPDAVSDVGEDPVGLLPQTGMRVGALGSATRGIKSVRLADPLPLAMSIMIEHGYSQVPVFDHLDTLRGVVTWASIAHMHATGREASVPNATTSEYHVVGPAAHLPEVLPFVRAHGFVLVRDGTGRLSGIVTTADLADQFISVAGPFFTLGEIERRLRRCLGRVYGEDDVRRVRKKYRHVNDLMFFDYVILLNHEERWHRLNWPGVDRTHFVGLLDRVRRIRNKVMHFNTATVGEEDQALLDRFASILRSYDPDPRSW